MKTLKSSLKRTCLPSCCTSTLLVLSNSAPKIAVLLVGGHSTRMGTDKFALEINGQPQWKFMLEQLNHFFEEVFISCRKDQESHFKGQQLIFDEHEDIGPMGAIFSSFRALESRYPTLSSSFFIACDMPAFDVRLSAKLHTAISPAYDVVAAWNTERKSAEPLAAFWNKSSLPSIEEFISQQNYALFKCMSQLRVKTVEIEDSTTLRNVNSLKDL